MAMFESYDRRIDQIQPVLAQYGFNSLDEAREYCESRGVDAYQIAKETQPIAFDNAGWAYTLGAAIALKEAEKKEGVLSASEAAEWIGQGLQTFCIPGSVAAQREVGLGHGRLGARLLSEETDCFCFLAGHESFAAAEGAIKIALNANKVRQKPLRVILNGLGKDAAYLIARINGFNYVQTQYDYNTGELNVVNERRFSEGARGDINCYGADDVREGVAIMHRENVDISITGNSTNPTRFQHPVAVPTKKSAWNKARHISPWPQVVVPAEPCTQTT